MSFETQGRWRVSTVYDVAVVGAGGFLGSAIASELDRRGHLVMRNTLENPLVDGGRWHPDAAGVRTVVWAAGMLTPAAAEDRPEAVAEQLAVFRDAVEAAAAQDVAPRMVLLSSGGAVYGPPARPPFREDHAAFPANAYGAFKWQEERILAEAAITTTAVRIANVYGPGQWGGRGQGVLPAWMAAIRDQRPIVMYGSGEVARDFVYVEDVADLIARVVERPDAPAVINAGSGKPTHLNDLLDLIEYTVGPENVRVQREPGRGVDAPSTWLDVTLAHQALGWRASTPLADGIARMWDWFAAA